jgi:hypothetical protein
LEHFTRFDEFDDLKISPDGKTLALTTGHNGRAELTCIGLGDNKVSGRLGMGEGYEVAAFDWLSPAQLVYTTNRPRYREVKPRTSALMFTADNRCRNPARIYGDRGRYYSASDKLRGQESDRATPRFLSAVKSNPNQAMIAEHPWRTKAEGVYYNDPDAVPRIGLWIPLAQ